MVDVDREFRERVRFSLHIKTLGMVCPSRVMAKRYGVSRRSINYWRRGVYVAKSPKIRNKIQMDFLRAEKKYVITGKASILIPLYDKQTSETFEYIRESGKEKRVSLLEKEIIDEFNKFDGIFQDSGNVGLRGKPKIVFKIYVNKNVIR